MGNITAILDSEGAVVVKYVYDAWGNHAVVDNSGNDIEDLQHIGNLNPFRYRGYYYDVEIGLYYLQTRYYDPELGRFISQDSINFANSQAVNGLNLYAYCLNIPIKYVDKTGCIPFANFIESTSYSKIIWGFNSRVWGRIYYSVGGSRSLSDNDEVGFFYAYHDTNLECLVSTYGAGINAWDWWGLDISVDTEFNLNFSQNLTPWFHTSVSIGLNGISMSLGLTINEVSHDFTIGLGLGLVAVVGGLATIVLSAGQALQPVLEFFKNVFSF